jgi:tetratricopeptide (TPR) repeat protein
VLKKNKMKKTVFVSVALLACNLVNAQANKTNAPAAKMNPHLKVFNQSMTSGDVPTGIISLNYYVNDQGANTVYEDTLAMLYMQEGSFVQCYYWADKRSKVKPDDNSLMEMKGICLEKLQQPKEAITIFEKLYGKTQSPYHAYKLMEIQYSIKRLAECLATAVSAEKLAYKPEYTVTYSTGNQNGRTYLQAGIYNIHALALYDLDRKAEAKTYFEKAVALDSTFVLARQNLEALKNIEAGVKQDNPVNQAQPANKQD